MKYSYLTLAERRKIEKMYNMDIRVAEIAKTIGKSEAAIYEELKRGYTGERNASFKKAYSAERAQMVFQNNLSRRGQRAATNDGAKLG